MLDIQKQTVKHLSDNLSTQFDEALIIGLKKKGYYFESRIELEEFIKTKCRAEDYQHLKEKVFFAEDKPFMKWNYEMKLNTVHLNDYKVTADMGNYIYL